MAAFQSLGDRQQQTDTNVGSPEKSFPCSGEECGIDSGDRAFYDFEDLALHSRASHAVAPVARMAPVQRADWVKFTQGLRQAGLAAYKAAQTKDSDKIIEVAGTVSDACAACHDIYREKKAGPQDRCLP